MNMKSMTFLHGQHWVNLHCKSALQVVKEIITCDSVVNMVPKDSSDCYVTVTIELGHTANFLKEPSLEGFTHDWTVFVRGKDGSKIEHFVEKVVFRLHKTFKSPNRSVLKPPYKVSEAGYAGFLLPIEIHFKNKQSPRKICFSYDLFLNVKDNPPINNSRFEKLKFSNPTPEFKAKLIKAGGVEHGPYPELQPLPYAKGSPLKTEKKKSNKKSKDSKQEKKKKKKHKPEKEASPAPSLSSLSPTSSSDDDDDHDGGGGGEIKHSSQPASAAPKKEKESVQKDSLFSAQSKTDTPSLSSHSKKPKYRDDSQNTSSKDRPEKEAVPKKHKSKERDKEKDKHVSSHKSNKDRKIKESSSHALKVSKEGSEAGFDHASPPQITKSLSSSNSEKKHSSSNPRPDSREKQPLVPKEASFSHQKEKHGGHKSKDSTSSSSKVKHTPQKDQCEPGSSKKHEHSDKKSKDKERHVKKVHKRSAEAVSPEEGVEKKKIKSESWGPEDGKSWKPKNTQGKSKDVDMKHSQKDLSKEIKVKASPPKDKEKELVVITKEKSEHSSSSNKHKITKDREKHVDKHKHGKEKHKDSTTKEDGSSRHKEIRKEEKPVKSAALLETEHLAMTADFQPRLLVSPLKSEPDSDVDSEANSDNETPEFKQKPAVKRTFSNTSVNSFHKTKANVKQEAQTVSGLTDSDSDSDDKEISVSPKEKSPIKEMDADVRKMKHRKFENSLEVPKGKKHTDESGRQVLTNLKFTKESSQDDMLDKGESSVNHVGSDVVESEDEDKKSANSEGLDILAPNGFSLRELIDINEKIERVTDDTRIMEKLVYLVGETDDFELDEKSFYFDICSLEKSVVKKIQNLLKEH
ncbi:protein af-9 [Plakobranchus ocellatus]|uniref:Protein af-9 n=1 Tax=Plakobranchus ocellatus TaxID=259542 RepID=A0AAV4DL83_9GAST|nr:protein af-9 [Plakobranchus ocellatus]